MQYDGTQDHASDVPYDGTQGQVCSTGMHYETKAQTCMVEQAKPNIKYAIVDCS